MAINRELLYLQEAPLMKVLASLAVFGFPASVWFICAGKDWQNYKVFCQIIGSLWVLGPPVWFFYEHYYYFPKHGNPLAGYAQLKASQDIAAKIWAAFLVILAALFTEAFPK